jgi:hypothetical protein
MAQLREDGVAAIEPVLSEAIRQLTVAKATSPATYLAVAAARVAGVSAPSITTTTANASVQCSLPFTSHACAASSQQQQQKQQRRQDPRDVRAYLEHAGVADLEAMMDGALMELSENARLQPPQTVGEWQALLAKSLLRKAGLQPGTERCDAVVQCGPRFVSHAPSSSKNE